MGWFGRKSSKDIDADGGDDDPAVPRGSPPHRHTPRGSQLPRITPRDSPLVRNLTIPPAQSASLSVPLTNRDSGSIGDYYIGENGLIYKTPTNGGGGLEVGVGEHTPSNNPTAGPTPLLRLPRSAEKLLDKFRKIPSQYPTPPRRSVSSQTRLVDADNTQAMEQVVLKAANAFGEKVQAIVISAKKSQQDDGAGPEKWKGQLLDLLEGRDGVGVGAGANRDIDALLKNSPCDRFVDRCVECMLPINLVHCLRMLRFLEKQSADSVRDRDVVVSPVSLGATDNVAKLFLLVVKDPLVGDQLRPQLKYLLFLSTAAYPQNAIHVAKAASNVVCAFARHCLSVPTTVFIHENNVIGDMTDDIWELCGLTTNLPQADEDHARSPNSLLYGTRAEALWVYALRPVVDLAVYACAIGRGELLRDFCVAKGYELLSGAVARASPERASELLKMIPELACSDPSGTDRTGRLVANPEALGVLEELMVQSIPFLFKFVERNEGKKPIRSGTNRFTQELIELAGDAVCDGTSDTGVMQSISTDAGGITTPDKVLVRIALEILVIAEQMYRSHDDNYGVIESNCHLLNSFILAYPTLKDASLKRHVLRILEGVCVASASVPHMPFQILNEIFYCSLTKLLQSPSDGRGGVSARSSSLPSAQALDEDVQIGPRALLEDASNLCEAIEKMIDIDDSISEVLCDWGLLGQKLDNLLRLVTKNLDCNNKSQQQCVNRNTLDRVVSYFCRILGLVAPRSRRSLAADSNQLNMNLFLLISVRSLGDVPSKAALSVLEGLLGMRNECIVDDLKCVFQLLREFAELGAKEGWSVERQIEGMNIICVAAESNEVAKDSFRDSGGFETLVKVMDGLAGAFSNVDIGIRCLRVLEAVLMVVKSTTFSIFTSTRDSRSSAAFVTTPEKANIDYFYRSKTSEKLAKSIVGTGVFSSPSAVAALKMAFSLVSGNIFLAGDGGVERAGLSPSSLWSLDELVTIDSPAAVLFLLSLSSHLPPFLAANALDVIARVSAPGSFGNAERLASCGLVQSITKEFGRFLEDGPGPLQMQFVNILRNFASYFMSQSDFLALLRCVVSPILMNEGKVTLPVITSFSAPLQKISINIKEDEFCSRLEKITTIAEMGERLAFCRLGDESFSQSSLSVSMKKITYELRRDHRVCEMALYTTKALRFIEIPSLLSEKTRPATSTSGQAVWNPGLGFTYSAWIMIPSQLESPQSDCRPVLSILDLCSTSTTDFLNFHYDCADSQLCVRSSTSKVVYFTPLCLVPDCWHHLMLSYAPTKVMFSKTASLSLYIDGIYHDDKKLEPIVQPAPNKGYVGCPNPVLAASSWGVSIHCAQFYLGPIFMSSGNLSSKEAMLLFMLGPEFFGSFVAENINNFFLSPIVTAFLIRLHGSTEDIRGALDQRNLKVLEEVHSHDKVFSKFPVSVPLESLIFSFHGRSNIVHCNKTSNNESGILHNISSYSEISSSNATVFGAGVIVSPFSFADNISRLGGPRVLFPIIYAAQSPSTLALSLRLLRAVVWEHSWNLQAMQLNEGFRILGLLLRHKRHFLTSKIMHECFAFAVDGFNPSKFSGSLSKRLISKWLFADIDAMKYLFMNHQIWGTRDEELLLVQLSFLNGLVDKECVNRKFNSQRLYHCGLTQWVINLMLEAAASYGVPGSGWSHKMPPTANVAAVGGDAGDDFLLSCKTLLKGILSWYIIPGEMNMITETVLQTITMRVGEPSRIKDGKEGTLNVLPPDAFLRVSLLRLLMELVSECIEKIWMILDEDENSVGFNGTLSAVLSSRRKDPKRGVPGEVDMYLNTLGDSLTPSWFSCIFELCNEEASASIAFRLMILLLQSSPEYYAIFDKAGGFLSLISSIPKFSSSSSIILPMLSQLIGVPIRRLPLLPSLDKIQLNELFDGETLDEVGVSQCGGIFSLLCECISRNFQLSGMECEKGLEAKNSNDAILSLLLQLHKSNAVFQTFCQKKQFLSPLIRCLFVLGDVFSSSKKEDPDTNYAKNDTELELIQEFLGQTHSGGSIIFEMLHSIISLNILHSNTSATMIDTIIDEIPSRSNMQQFQLFQMIIVVMVKKEINEHFMFADSRTFANAIGIVSVLFNQILCGLHIPEAIMTTSVMIYNILDGLFSTHFAAKKVLDPQLWNILTYDTVYMAQMMTVVVISLSISNRGPDKMVTLDIISKNIRNILNISDMTSLHQANLAASSTSSKYHSVWKSSSLVRAWSTTCNYSDHLELDVPDHSFITSMLSLCHIILRDAAVDVQESIAKMIVTLMQMRKSFVSELFMLQMANGDVIDLMRGGFGALLLSSEPSYGSSIKVSSFLEWMIFNENRVNLVFENIHIKASQYIPLITDAPHSTTIQKDGLSDFIPYGAFEPGDQLIQFASKNASDLHSKWKIQGIGDLTAGAMHLKQSIRQLKGSCSVWESNSNEEKDLNDHASEIKTENKIERWKLDPTEGYERARRRLQRNYEFNELYNICNSLNVIPAEKNIGANIGIGPVEQPSDPLLLLRKLRESSLNVLCDNDILEDTNFTVEQVKRATETFALSQNEDDESDCISDFNSISSPLASTISLDGSAADENISMASSTMDEYKTEEEEEHNHNCDNDSSDSENDESFRMSERLSASNYELITGLLHANDRPIRTFNVSRCTGLEVTQSLLLYCRNALYIADGFQVEKGDDLYGTIIRVDVSNSTYSVNLRQNEINMNRRTEERSVPHSNNGDSTSAQNEKNKGRQNTSFNNDDEEISYRHQSQRLAFEDIYSVFKRRYQLRPVALELFDVHRNGIFISFGSSSERDELLSKILSQPLHNSIFHSSRNLIPSSIGGAAGPLGLSLYNFDKFMKNWRAKVTYQWTEGRISNFEYLMHLNTFAGRTYNDLTQYPVFPWIINDYESETINLNDQKIYRDLSKPMGALSEPRATQFRERYEALAAYTEESPDEPPPFHYGTHYSCEGYVLYYLVRLEPYSRLALSLQGGRFDVADRLFSSVAASWKSASEENLQDVRELIPEFFHLPEFLENSNMFDFGQTQSGESVHHVNIPKWANNDPKTFIQINRQALESEYVSKNLHHWIDLIFGYKQKGTESILAQNTFVHLTYAGQVDIDSIIDEHERAATIAQIDHFGQTPGRLDRRPHPQRKIPNAFKDQCVDLNALSSLAYLTPPFCIVGAPHRIYLRAVGWDTCSVGMSGQTDSCVGDICMMKDKMIGVGKTCVLLRSSAKYFRYGGLNNGVSIHSAVTSTQQRDVNQVLNVYDNLHSAPISAAKMSLNGAWLVTGCEDSTVRVWSVKKYSKNLQLKSTLCGHENGLVSCIDISTTFGIIVTGGKDGKVIEWDLRQLLFMRQLLSNSNLKTRVSRSSSAPKKVLSVSINGRNGNILNLVESDLSLFDINGNLVASCNPSSGIDGVVASSAVATDCPEWMNGAVAVTGHVNGDIKIWSIDYMTKSLIFQHAVPDKIHSCSITALCVHGNLQNTLLAGDASGKMSLWRTVKLENFNSQELSVIQNELDIEKGRGTVY